jgi:hypothetical protein
LPDRVESASFVPDCTPFHIVGWMAEISLTQDPEAVRADPPVAQVWNILVATGLAMTVTGVLHLGITPLPVRIHNAHWKFMTAGATIDGFTIVTAGMVALGCGLIARASTRPLRVYAVTAALMALGLAAVYAGFLSTLPRIAEMTQSLAETETVQAGVYLTSVTAVVTMLLFGGLAWVAWERASSLRP